MENTNEGTVTISLQRYKELEGYEKDSLNLIAEVNLRGDRLAKVRVTWFAIGIIITSIIAAIF